MSEKLERREFIKPREIQSLYTEQHIEVLQRMVEMHQAKLEEAERRIAAIERKLNHKTSKHDSNQEEQGGADELADD